MSCCIFYQVSLTGSGLLNMPGAEVCYRLDKKCPKKSLFIIENFFFMKKWPALAQRGEGAPPVHHPPGRLGGGEEEEDQQEGQRQAPSLQHSHRVHTVP